MNADTDFICHFTSTKYKKVNLLELIKGIFDGVGKEVQLKFLMLTKSDVKEGQRDRQWKDRAESEGEVAGVGKVAGVHEGPLGVSGAVG